MVIIMEYDKKHYEYALVEIQRHLQDAARNKIDYFDMADYYKDKSRKFNIYHSITLAIITTLLLASPFNGIIPSDHYIVKVSLIIIGVVHAVFTTLGYILKFEEKFNENKSAAMRYHNLWRNCLNWKTDFPDETMTKEAVRMAQRYREQINDINRDSPHFTLSDRERIKKWKEGKKDAMSDNEIIKYELDEKSDETTV